MNLNELPVGPPRRINIEGLGEVVVEDLLDGAMIRMKFGILAVIMDPFIIPQMEKVAAMKPSNHEEQLLKDSLNLLWRAFHGTDNGFAMAVSTLFSTLCVLREEDPPLGQIELFPDAEHPQPPTRKELLDDIEKKIRAGEEAINTMEAAKAAIDRGEHVIQNSQGGLSTVRRGSLMLWGTALIISITALGGQYFFSETPPEAWLWGIPVGLAVFAKFLVGEKKVIPLNPDEETMDPTNEKEEREKDNDEPDNRS